ncbi:MAG: M20 aminoacylase family protein [Rhodospirillales bacterium]
MPVRQRFAELLPQIAAWRHDIHQHPELQFDTQRTSAMVAENLRAFGCDEVVTGIGRTGVVGVIKGKLNTSGRAVGLRADMDALPIEEATDVEYASKNKGVMHACGHDGHTAMLLGAAKYLADTRDFDGSAVVIFQPAEEGGGGGREMCEDGMMDRFGIQEVYGMHTWPGRPAGTFSIRPGPFFASADQFEIEVEGRGGHAAKPNFTVDTTVTAAHIVTALQTIVSRNADPVDQIVLSVTSFETSTKAFNVIPQTVTLRGTLRTLSPENRAMGERRLKEIAEGTAAAFGAAARVNFMPGYPVMVNSGDETGHAAAAAAKVCGMCEEAPLVMGGEDFAYMLQERPGAYILLGNGDTPMVHHPEYNFNDDAIPAGCSWWVEMAESRMPLGA